MKICVTSQGQDLSSEIDPRFGRARCFIIYDLSLIHISEPTRPY